ncbi:cilia- and flagella-associated protein 418 isoform X2 [Cygnus atratus]|uniref:cilia- and flagella-associated protein 418 isoform X2 n=1 Tax=Cygnus atratus TaxID=8868 RepID=UPI0021B7E578|nr:cilia- and flagella-associated protein 418 isoform X2 [Cygnus atratus]
MADDLERLLDEVEARLCRLSARGAARGPLHGGREDEEGEEEEEGAAAKGRSAKMLMSPGSSEEDIDDVIDEICNDSFAKMPLKLKSNSARFIPENNSAAVQTHRRRCCPVYLGGSSSPNGIGTNISKRTCDQLRCTACDFRVSLFNDYIWDQSCDYLFFRNNMPELSKLRAKMIKKKGSRAYACQCSWRSINELTDLQADQQLRCWCYSGNNYFTD